MIEKNLNLNFVFQSTTKTREVIIEKLFNISSEPYRKYIKKNTRWNITRAELLNYPSGTVGYELGLFLHQNDFQLLEKSETHDVFHLLSNYSTAVTDEVAMQFYLFGNGKKSPYLFTVLAIGSLFYPEFYEYFKESYAQGKKALPFYNFDFYKHLNMNLNELKKQFKIW
jgi:ubiquinone biosynthesis protein Coq4